MRVDDVLVCRTRVELFVRGGRVFELDELSVHHRRKVRHAIVQYRPH